MGTIGCYGLKKDNKYKVTYCHYDSYLEGLGQDLLEELRKVSVKGLRKTFDHIMLVDLDSTPTEEQIEECRKYADIKVSNCTLTDWYCLLRRTQGTLQPYIDKEIKPMIDGIDLFKDQYCHFYYIIDLDKEVFEIIVGNEAYELKLSELDNITDLASTIEELMAG